MAQANEPGIGRLVLTVRSGQKVRIGTNIVAWLEHPGFRGRLHLVIEAPRDVVILREGLERWGGDG